MHLVTTEAGADDFSPERLQFDKRKIYIYMRGWEKKKQAPDRQAVEFC